MIKSLQSLRAIGAIMIFIHHFGFDNRVVMSFGDCAVNWFMMMSGFVLCAAHENRLATMYSSGVLTPTISDVRSFMSKRIKHVAPMYFTGVLLMIMLRFSDFNVMTLIPTLFMVQSWIPIDGFFFAYNSPAWFISDIVFCYLWFLPLLWYISTKKRGALKLLAIVLAGYCAMLLLVPPSSPRVYYLFYIFPVMQLPAFILGIILWQIASRIKRPRSAALSNLLIISALFLVVLSMAGYGILPDRLNLSSYWWISTVALLLVLTITDATDCFLTRLLHWQPLLMLGNASMAFYLLHLPWITGTRLFLQAIDIRVPAAVELPVSILLLAVISYTIHKCLGRKKA